MLYRPSLVQNGNIFFVYVTVELDYIVAWCTF
jgi:hypothetical protein